MAVMIPPQLDREVESRAERVLFGLFESQLPPEFTVMHQVGIMLRSSSHGDKTGELDFLIIHPKLGILALEVKGGKITFDRQSENWFTENSGGKINKLKVSPAKQLERTAYLLRDKVRELPKTRHLEIEIVRGWAFPDSLTERLDFGSDMPSASIIGGKDLADIASAIVRLYGNDVRRRPLAQEERTGLINALRPTRQVSQFALMSEIASNEIVIKQLTEAQFSLLDHLQAHRQAVINGCAGSGKTMLALEKARSLAGQGFDVLLTCYNKGLSAWLKRNVETFEKDVKSRIYTAHYHDLAVQLCEEAGVPIENIRQRAKVSSFWESELPELLEQATATLDRKFDAVIADEGQDFDSGWWISLTSLLRDPNEGIFYIFRDLQQDIYGRDHLLPFSVPPITLNVNHRNTQAIHSFSSTYVRGSPKPTADGPAGRLPEMIPATDSTLLKELGSIVHRLTQVEGIEHENIVILTPRSASSSIVKEGVPLATFTVTWNATKQGKTIRVCSIYGFKGLESQVVLLVEPSHLAHWGRWRELCYVALSRARHHLIILGNLPDQVEPAKE